MKATKPNRNTERRNMQGERTRLSILKASARLFAQRGYDNVSIREISADLDVAPSLVIHHFGNKAALYRKTVRYFLGDGALFQHAAEPLTKVDPEDKQVAANALAECIHIFFEIWHGPNRVRHLDRLMLQVIFGRGSVDVPLALEWIGPCERLFEDFFMKVNPSLTREDADVRMEIFFSHIFYPSVIRKLLCSEHGWKDFPRDFLLRWKKNIAADFCLGTGLPTPTFIYPEEGETAGAARVYKHRAAVSVAQPTPLRPFAVAHPHRRRGGAQNRASDETAAGGEFPADAAGAATGDAETAAGDTNAHGDAAEASEPRRRITRHPLILPRPGELHRSSLLPRLFPKPESTASTSDLLPD